VLMRTLKRRVKTCLSDMLVAAGPCPWLLRCRPLILMYHRILPEAEAARSHTSPYIITHEQTFALQMRYLADHCLPVPLSDLVSALAQNKRLAPLTVAVTFDDGWEDNSTVALPILKRYSIPATVFLTTSFIGSTRVFWQERLRFLLMQLAANESRLAPALPGFLSGQPDAVKALPLAQQQDARVVAGIEELPVDVRESFLDTLQSFLGRPAFDQARHAFLSWEQAAEMHCAGVELGSHTVSHHNLTRLSDQELANELTESKALLREKLNIDATALAYPTGYYDARVMAAARTAGYSVAVTTEKRALDRKDAPLALPRLNICESRFLAPSGRFSPNMFAAALAGFF